MSARSAGRIALRTVAVIVLWLALAMIAGRIPFAPWATNLLVDVTSRLGIFGIESVENFYMAATLLVTLIAAIAVVLLIERALRRRGAAA